MFIMDCMVWRDIDEIKKKIGMLKGHKILLVRQWQRDKKTMPSLRKAYLKDIQNCNEAIKHYKEKLIEME